eukprot:scaffold3170_cov128-Cylindrotheca_fusiformis.AAC.1
MGLIVSHGHQDRPLLAFLTAPTTKSSQWLVKLDLKSGLFFETPPLSTMNQGPLPVFIYVMDCNSRLLQVRTSNSQGVLTQAQELIGLTDRIAKSWRYIPAISFKQRFVCRINILLQRVTANVHSCRAKKDISDILHPSLARVLDRQFREFREKVGRGVLEVFA